jgi:hypothetical protein
MTPEAQTCVTRACDLFFCSGKVHEIGTAGVSKIRGATMPSSLQPAGTRRRARTAWSLACFALAVFGCDDYTRCEAPDPDQMAALPALLSETGLYENAELEILAEGVERFRPLEALWSDGAEKERYIWLPPGAMIDTSDMDDWRFPAGTKLWKTFIRDGVRVETRFLHKLRQSADSWTAAAYIYSEDGSEAQLTAAGADDVLGTEHDVPAASQCPACHGGRESFVLGFSAIQLAHAQAELTLARLVEANLLSDPPEREPRIPGSETQRAALAYLHANCGHCHNSARPPQREERCFDPENDLDFWLRINSLSTPQQTPTYRSGIEHNCIDPGDPESSQMIRRMSRRGGGQMPPLATELVDQRAVSLLRRWIDEM